VGAAAAVNFIFEVFLMSLALSYRAKRWGFALFVVFILKCSLLADGTE
jgi:hypothetical protein